MFREVLLAFINSIQGRVKELSHEQTSTFFFVNQLQYKKHTVWTWIFGPILYILRSFLLHMESIFFRDNIVWHENAGKAYTWTNLKQ